MARGDLRPGESGRGSAMTVGLSWMVDWGEWAGGRPWLERRKGQRFHVPGFLEKALTAGSFKGMGRRAFQAEATA